MKLVRFNLSGRVGHFLRAEANASSPSYPVPPRTALLGILGAVIGLGKDEPQTKLEPAQIALSGKLPLTHWHKAKLRKDPPENLSWEVKKNQELERQTKPERVGLVTQEWLFQPVYTVWAGLPEPQLSEFEARLRDRRWFFTPCLGLSEMLADLVFEETVDAVPLPPGIHPVASVFPRDIGVLQTEQLFKAGLALHALRMPNTVSPDRVFTHRSYFLEREARPVPVQTNQAFQVGEMTIAFL